MADINLKPSEFAASVAIGDNDIFPRSVNTGPGTYTDNKTFISDFKNRIAPLTTKGDLLIFGSGPDSTRIPVGADGQFLRANSADALGVAWQTITTTDISEGTNLYFTSIRALAAVEKINDTIGWYMEGGADSKQLTVLENSTINQDLQQSASPTFSSLNLINANGTINLNYDVGLFTYDLSDDSHVHLFNQEVRARKTTGWIAGSFGATATDPVVVIGTLSSLASIGAHNNSLNAWDDLYITPEAIISGANTGIGLSIATSSQTANATFHSGGTTIFGAATSAIADALIYNNQVNVWFDEGAGNLVFKAKDSGGSITNFPLSSGGTADSKWEIISGFSDTIEPKQSLSITKIRLYDPGHAQYAQIDKTNNNTIFTSTSGEFQFNRSIEYSAIATPAAPAAGNIKTYVDSGNNQWQYITSDNYSYRISGYRRKVITAATYNVLPGDDIIAIDTTSNNVNIVVNAGMIQDRNVVIFWRQGGNTASFQADSGHTINGLGTAYTIGTQWTAAEISTAADTSSAMFIKSYSAA